MERMRKKKSMPQPFHFYYTSADWLDWLRAQSSVRPSGCVNYAGRLIHLFQNIISCNTSQAIGVADCHPI